MPPSVLVKCNKLIWTCDFVFELIINVKCSHCNIMMKRYSGMFEIFFNVYCVMLMRNLLCWCNMMSCRVYADSFTCHTRYFVSSSYDQMMLSTTHCHCIMLMAAFWVLATASYGGVQLSYARNSRLAVSGKTVYNIIVQWVIALLSHQFIVAVYIQIFWLSYLLLLLPWLWLLIVIIASVTCVFSWVKLICSLVFVAWAQDSNLFSVDLVWSCTLLCQYTDCCSVC